MNDTYLNDKRSSDEIYNCILRDTNTLRMRELGSRRAWENVRWLVYQLQDEAERAGRIQDWE